MCGWFGGVGVFVPFTISRASASSLSLLDSDLAGLGPLIFFLKWGFNVRQMSDYTYNYKFARTLWFCNNVCKKCRKDFQGIGL